MLMCWASARAWLQGGLVFKAHRLLHVSTLGSRVIKKKRRSWRDLIIAAFDERLDRREHPLHHAPCTLHPTPFTLHCLQEAYTLAFRFQKVVLFLIVTVRVYGARYGVSGVGCRV